MEKRCIALTSTLTAHHAEKAILLQMPDVQPKLQQHQIMEHASPGKEQTVLKCSKCTKVFRTPSAHHAHKNAHADPKFACENCDKQFLFESALRLHQKLHTTTQVFCRWMHKV